MSGKTEYCGVVEAVGNGSVRVRVGRSEACGSCSVSGRCGGNGRTEMTVEATVKGADALKKGDAVVLSASSNMGRKAVLVGLALPLLLMLAALLATASCTDDTLLQSLVPIAAVLAYYLLLYINRSRLNERFKIEASMK